MSNLTNFNKTPSFEYDWSLIEDGNDRTVVKSAVNTYKATFEKLRSQADTLIKEDNVAKARCVFTLKETLDHGQFMDVCNQSLGLSSTTASALASTGRLLMEGDHTEQVLEMMSVMEPRAGNKFLKSDDETKMNYVVQFEETGQVPSQRDFRQPQTNTYQPTKKMEYESEVPFKVKLEPTTSDKEAEDRLKTYKIRPVHFLGWLNTELSRRDSINDDMKEELSNLMFQMKRLSID